jgi:hypothetical protein
MSFPVMSTTVPWSLVKNGFHKTPHYNSVDQLPAAGRGRSTFGLMPYPTWDFNLDLNYVLGGESVQGSVLASFLSCYMLCCGGAGFFLFTDPNDSAVTLAGSAMLNVTPGAALPMGQVGDGTSTKFQLARKIGTAPDIQQNVIVTQVQVAGVTKALGTDYSLSSTGVITFVVAPAASAALTWAGSFQYLCKFTDDTLRDLARVSKNSGGFLWSCSSIQFESVFV